MKNSKLDIGVLCSDSILLSTSLVLYLINCYSSKTINNDFLKVFVVISLVFTFLSLAFIYLKSVFLKESSESSSNKLKESDQKKRNKDNITSKKIIGWVVSIAVAIIGTFGAAASIENSKNVEQHNSKVDHNNTQTTNDIPVIVDGVEIMINKDNAQYLYDSIENEKHSLETLVGDLKDELYNYKKYGVDALVSVNENYESKKASIFGFKVVNSLEWVKKIDTVKDSLDNEYDVSLPYVVMNGHSYAEYYTNENFSKLKFTLAAHETMKNGNTASVKIIVDGNVIKSIDGITRSYIPQTYTLNIENSKFIKIQCESTDENNSYKDTQVMLLDAQFIK